MVVVDVRLESLFPATQQQAKLFNWADVFVSSHGAHFANHVFMRPGSMVVEISCSQMSYITLRYAAHHTSSMRFSKQNSGRIDKPQC